MKPICVKCRRYYRPKKNGTYFVENMPIGSEKAEPGLSNPEKWTAYKLHVGDLWECEGCHNQIISGVGQGAIREHFMDDFKAMVKQTGAVIEVNDC